MSFLGPSNGLVVVPQGGPPGPIGPPGTPGAPGAPGFPIGNNIIFHASAPAGGSVLVASFPIIAPNQQLMFVSYGSALNDTDPQSYAFIYFVALGKVDNLSVGSFLNGTGFSFTGSNPSPSFFTQVTPLAFEFYGNNILVASPTDFQVQVCAMQVTSPNVPP